MAVQTVGAFFAGVVVGWTGRSVIGSTREALIQAVILGHRVREGARRVVAEQVEWAEDMFAEGRARFEARRDGDAFDAAAEARAAYDDDAVLDIKKKRGQAA
jgi:hypothetical protein